jgi:hypothetical protein
MTKDVHCHSWQLKGTTMKIKHAAAAVTIALTTLSLVAFAEKQAQRERIFLLKSGGETLGELHLRGSGNLAIQPANSSATSDYDMATGVMRAKGGAVLTLTSGTNSISVRAEEIESVPDSQ